jgi:hypothetical protein
MIPQPKVVFALDETSKTAAATATARFDTLGYDASPSWSGPAPPTSCRTSRPS